MIIWLDMKCLQVMLGSVECTILIPSSVLIQCFADGEKAYFQKEFAAAQEEIERQKKVLRDAKKVDINTFRAKTNFIDEFFCQVKKRKSETLRQDAIFVSRLVRIYLSSIARIFINP